MVFNMDLPEPTTGVDVVDNKELVYSGHFLKISLGTAYTEQERCRCKPTLNVQK